MSKSLRRDEGLLILYDGFQDSLSLRSSTEAFCLPKSDPNKFPKRTLTELIQKHRSFAPPSEASNCKALFNHTDRRSLAAKLSFHLLVFYAWRHTSRPWNGDEVYFLSSTEEEHEKNKPFASCYVGQEEILELSTVDDGPLPCFTAFAKLLLEIEYGAVPAGDFSADNDYGWKILRDFHTTMKSWGDLSRWSYLEAVDSCLRFDQYYLKARSTAAGRLETQEETFRKLVFTNIVRKISPDPTKSSCRKRRRSEVLTIPEDEPDSRPSFETNTKGKQRETVLVVPPNKRVALSRGQKSVTDSISSTAVHRGKPELPPGLTLDCIDPGMEDTMSALPCTITC